MTISNANGIVIPDDDEAWAMVENGTDEAAALIRSEAANIKAEELEGRNIIAKHVELLISKGIMETKASSVIYNCKMIQSGNKKLIGLKPKRECLVCNAHAYWMDMTGNTMTHYLTGQLGQPTIQDGDA